MKKIFILASTLLMLVVPMHLFAQNSKWVIGIEGGAGRANLTGNQFITENNLDRIGYSAGLTVQYNLSRILSLRSGVSYERKGSREDRILTFYDSLVGNPFVEVPYKVSSSFDYLTIPLLLRATIGTRVKYFANVGPYVSFLLKQTDERKASSYFSEVSLDNSDIYKNIDLGVSLGAGVEHPINHRVGFSIELRHNQGLLNASQYFLIGNEPIHHSVTNVLLGLSYSLGAEKQQDN